MLVLFYIESIYFSPWTWISYIIGSVLGIFRKNWIFTFFLWIQGKLRFPFKGRSMLPPVSEAQINTCKFYSLKRSGDVGAWVNKTIKRVPQLLRWHNWAETMGLADGFHGSRAWPSWYPMPYSLSSDLTHVELILSLNSKACSLISSKLNEELTLHQALWSLMLVKNLRLWQISILILVVFEVLFKVVICVVTKLCLDWLDEQYSFICSELDDYFPTSGHMLPLPTFFFPRHSLWGHRRTYTWRSRSSSLAISWSREPLPVEELAITLGVSLSWEEMIISQRKAAKNRAWHMGDQLSSISPPQLGSDYFTFSLGPWPTLMLSRDTPAISSVSGSMCTWQYICLDSHFCNQPVQSSYAALGPWTGLDCQKIDPPSDLTALLLQNVSQWVLDTKLKEYMLNAPLFQRCAALSAVHGKNPISLAGSFLAPEP